MQCTAVLRVLRSAWPSCAWPMNISVAEPCEKTRYPVRKPGLEPSLNG